MLSAIGKCIHDLVHKFSENLLIIVVFPLLAIMVDQVK